MASHPMTRELAFLATLFVVAGVLVSPIATAAEMTWTMQDRAFRPIQFKLFSQRRNALWPNEKQAYTLFDSKPHSVKIECIRGEGICYGAWTEDNSAYWGVGPHNDQACHNNCCFVCGTGDANIGIDAAK
jgi:hypothetical protein